MPTTFDVIVLGTDSASQNVAYTCREAGWNVAVVDSRPFGGTCQLRGCDPKKVLVGVADLVDWSHCMQGDIVARNLLEGNRHTPNYAGIPSVVFTTPPLARVGLLEEAARAQGLRFTTHHEDTSSWYSSRRVALSHTGFKVLVEEGTERLLGAHLLRLPAEEVINLFASGCQLLISITSAGQILPLGQPPYVVLIERALRDEGTSYHYLPPTPYSHLDPALRELVSTRWEYGRLPLYVGASWTTDAPFRETEAMIARCRAKGILAVEMEAAALYTLAQARQFQIICFAHVTNQLGQTEGDFEKGEASGSETALSVVSQTAHAWRQRETEPTQPI